MSKKPAARKAHVVGKHPHHATAAPGPAIQKLQQQVTSLQHQVSSLKHQGTSKHKGTRKHTVKRGWSPDGDVALCSARAVAESLRLALGVAVADEDVLDLYWSVATDADAGASIEDVLGAVQRRGLHDFRPLGFGPLEAQPLGQHVCEPLIDLIGDLGHAGWQPDAILSFVHGSSLILGVDWPEPHAVVAYDGFWWSWRERYEPWTDQVSEAWALQWQ